MHTSQQLIWLIESRLADNPSLDEIAGAAGLSRFHVSRLFAEETGITFSAYLRGRRLSEAAKRLLAGAPDILSVALEAGYNSHEAFTRAFRDQFGLTPDSVRRRGFEEPLRLIEAFRLSAPSAESIAPPVVEILPAATYVGFARRYAYTAMAGVPEQWKAFAPHLSGLAPSDFFGIVRSSGEDVEYICAIRDGGGLERGGNLCAVRLPAMRMAKFEHRGHIAGIVATCRAIFETALPARGLTPMGPVDLIEHYDSHFDSRSGFGTVGVWVQVAP